MRRAVVLAVLAFSASAQAQPASPPAAGAKYVSMGSSFAAGPGITTPADNPNTRCNRSNDNYAHQLARRHNLALTDVSCGGATTAHLLGPWNELPPQLDAVTADTRLVTVTIGGNDLGYLGGLSAASCHFLIDNGVAQPRCGNRPALPDDKAYADTEARMRQVVAEVHKRAPQARLVIVDYITILPPSGACPAIVHSLEDADNSRAIGKRLTEITARVAHDTGTDLIAASKLTQGHDACAADAWVNGYPEPGKPFSGTPFHPRLAAMTAITDALDKLIWGTGGH